MSNKKTIELKNKLSEIRKLSQLLNEVGETHDLSPKVLFALNNPGVKSFDIFSPHLF